MEYLLKSDLRVVRVTYLQVLVCVCVVAYEDLHLCLVTISDSKMIWCILTSITYIQTINYKLYTILCETMGITCWVSIEYT